MPTKRRPQLKLGTFGHWRREALCLCGCPRQVSGRQLFYDAACRRKHFRRVEKAERVLGERWHPSQIQWHNLGLDALLEKNAITRQEYRSLHIAPELDTLEMRRLRQEYAESTVSHTPNE